MTMQNQMSVKEVIDFLSGLPEEMVVCGVAHEHDEVIDAVGACATVGRRTNRRVTIELMMPDQRIGRDEGYANP